MNKQSSTISPLLGVDQLEVISLQDNIVELLTTVDREEVQTVLQWVKREEGERPPLPLAVSGFTFILATDKYAVTWHKAALEAIAFLASVAFIAASVKRQSQTFLYSGAAFLLFVITYVNYEHFADRIGMPIALLITGVVLIGLGLGTGQLSKRIRAPQ